MENIELTLNRNKSFSSVNEIQNLHLDFENEEKLLPVSDLQGTIDAYEQYLTEKDACNTYRFIFTIRPYCSNILFKVLRVMITVVIAKYGFIVVPAKIIII